MGWRRAEFKGQKVWAEVDERGQLKVAGGRVGIRYQKTPGAKIYGGGASRVELDPNAPIEVIEDGGASAEAPKVKSARSSGFGKAGTRTKGQAAMAADAARKLIDSLDGAILAFTDGACRGNPGPAGAGAALRFPDGHRLEASRSLGIGTNNIGELSAIGLALELLERARVKRSAQIALFTDSAYAHGVLVKGWKAKANRELIEEVRERMERWPNLELFWIAGHVGVEGNERADELANEGVDGISAVYQA
jgi:ribonuclease HI